MKLLILFLIVAISAQPLQAGFCDMEMEEGQESSHHMEPSEQTGHDCCGSDASGAQEGCDGEMNCGFCFASVSALPGMIRINATWTINFSPDISSGVVLPSHSSPPFRPPIH
jgi:hypothetical protein